ncbi:MAG TPA: AMP-binding protein [Acidimicrobiales bacterium]|nr:AMP-binding protein [Acidimicrobiales bacterium]
MTDTQAGRQGAPATQGDIAERQGAPATQSEVEDTDAKARRREARIHAAQTGMTLAWWARQQPERPAIISDAGDRTFGELNANANRAAQALRARGLGAGDSLSLICSNRPEFAETLAACQRIGVRLTTVNWHLTGPEMAYIIEDSEAKAVVGDARFAPAIEAAIAEVATSPPILFAVGGPIDGFEDYATAIAPQDGADIDDPVVGRTMLYTSGTTGRPKGVDRPVTAAAAAEAARTPTATQAASRYNPATDMHLCTGPLYHAAPLAFSLSGPLAAGVGVVVMDGWDARLALELIERHGITHTHMVPTMFHRLLAIPEDERNKRDLSKLRYVIHGAAPCPVQVKKALIDWLGPVVYEYYAATEGSGSFVDSETWLTKPGTVGKPATDDHVRILDEDKQELPRNEVGTVYLKAPATGRFRYYKDDAKTTSSYLGDEGYFTLGDHGYLDDDGYLFLTGRSAELIISGGVNIYPAEVDAVLLTHPAVGDVGVIGIPSGDWGEEVKAVVELKAGIEPSLELAGELVEFCRQRLAHFKCPRTVDFLDELPRHDNGKLYRRKLRELYVTDEDPTGHRTAQA